MTTTKTRRTQQEIAAVTDWAEQRGMENLREHLLAMDDLKKESNTTLTIFLAGGGASFGYALNHVADINLRSIVLASIAAGVYIFVLAAFLLRNCLTIKDAPSAANEGVNLFKPKYPLQKLKEFELPNLQERGNKAKARNVKTAWWLNHLRYFALLSPIVFAVTYAAGRFHYLF